MYSIAKGNIMETFRFDMRGGKTPEPSQVDPLCNWGLSPDGSVRAMVSSPKWTIGLRSTLTGEPNDLSVKGIYELGSLDWAPDGRSFFVSGRSHDGQSVLLTITLDGRVSVLLRSNNSEILAAIPSPNGRFLAIPEARGSNNVWAVENF
jgi:WD40 repeat protein